MEYVGTIGACNFNDTANASLGYLLNIPGYSQTNTDVVINEFSANTVTPSINSPSNLAAATLWNTPHYLHFVNTSKGAWVLTSELFNNYQNVQGHSLLMFMRFKCATPPTGADTFFLGNVIGGVDSFGIRVRKVGTTSPVGGDGQLVFAAYDPSGGPFGFQSSVNICDNVEHSIGIVIDRTQNKGYIFIDGALDTNTTLHAALLTNSFKTPTHTGIGSVGGNNALSNALACDLRDVKIVYTPNSCKSISSLQTLFNKLHYQPYYTITKDDWGY